MSILEYPEKSCFSCGKNIWWYSGMDKTYKGPHDQWICGTCTPPSDPILVLKMRIMRGNYLLTQRRRQIDLLDDPDLQRAERQVWGEGVKNLVKMSQELQDSSCLYIENGKKVKKCVIDNSPGYIECFFHCRNQYWYKQEIDEIWFGQLGQGARR
jgi:hypothetical protein